MSNSHLPPLSAGGVIAVSSSALIEAPREKVWEILMDFKSYDQWNSFVRKQVVCDASKRVLDDQTPAEGRYLSISVNAPPTMGKPGLFGTGGAFVIISTFDHENYRAAWKTHGIPGFLLRTERWQALSTDEATGKTKYETIEVFAGLAAYLIKWFYFSRLRRGFQAMADDLKMRAESSQ